MRWRIPPVSRRSDGLSGVDLEALEIQVVIKYILKAKRWHSHLLAFALRFLSFWDVKAKLLSEP